MIKVIFVIYLYEVVISVFIICLSHHHGKTAGPIGPTFFYTDPPWPRHGKKIIFLNIFFPNIFLFDFFLSFMIFLKFFLFVFG